VIGITGMDAGLGVTHLALSASAYCASKRRMRTALLEFHRRDELSLLSAQDPSSGFFCIHNIDCYAQANSAIMPYILNRGYERIIIDMGRIREADISELLRCDARYVISCTAPWKARSLSEFQSYFDESVNLGESFNYLMQTGCNRNSLSISDEVTIPARACRSVPFIRNPFSIEKELFLFLEEITQ
jgi:hypothetical protein